MKIVFFKRPKPKSFDYKPRYWDPEAEEFERRKRELDGDGNDDKTEHSHRDDLRNQINTQWRRRHEPDSSGQSAKWMKLFVYALIIFFGIYFIFFTGFINSLVRFFTE